MVCRQCWFVSQLKTVTNVIYSVRKILNLLLLNLAKSDLKYILPQPRTNMCGYYNWFKATTRRVEGRKEERGN